MMGDKITDRHDQQHYFPTTSLAGSKGPLHQASASMLRQLCDDACNSILVENNGVAPEWGYNLFSSDSTDFNVN